ncbi:GNAT family N-acetyltransferase [Paraburkholderia ferrariae]|uniref:GNAT family N-acetyltransferase n=1 Tax=Paraburkholderia ferrariae TaxID=386056 RepID=A0ABU9RMA5_9BURK
MASKSIRRATAEDVAVLTQIRNEACTWKIAHRDYAWGKEGDGVSEQWMRNTVAQKEVYVAELDGTPAGMFALDLDDEQRWGRQEPIAGYVHGLSVRAGFNGRGLGGFMLDCCAIRVSGLSRRYVRLDCPAHNAKLCAWYESLGFIRTGLWQEPGPDGYVWSLYERIAIQHLT